MAVAFVLVLVFAFLFFFVLGWGITTQTVPVRSNFHHDQVTITHSCHVKGESCFFFHGKTFKNSELSYQYV